MNGVEQSGLIPSNETCTSQQSLQPKKSCNCKEPRHWITEKDWTIYIREHSDDNCRLPSVVSIFRVPEILKKSNKDAYVPNIVSLGPYNHRNAELPQMGNQKGKALGMMRTRFNNSKYNSNVANVTDSKDFSYRAREEIMKLEIKIRDSYEEKIECDGETLARMLTLDGCFILEILRTLSGDELSIAMAQRCYQPIFGIDKIWYARSDALRDILLLENQIPLIVLQKLLELESNSVGNIENTILAMSRKLIPRFCPFAYEDMMARYSWHQVNVHDHLLGLMYGLIVCGLSEKVADRTNSNECNNAWRNHNPLKCAWGKLIKILVKCCSADRAVEHEHRIPCATELKKAGIKFKRSDGGIKFDRNNATIYLPHMAIRDSTEIVLRNLIAFEMCKPSLINYITCYVDFMDQLIDSKDDVIVLTKKGIITKYLGSDAEIAELFNGLCKGVTTSKTDVFKEVRREVNVHYTNEINVQIALLVEEHFQSPWKIVAWAVAIFLLCLTTLQTIYAVLSYY